MVKINGYWYNQDEIKEALENIGYTVVTLEVSTDPRDYPLYETYAIIDGAEPNPINRIKSVAVKEFEKPKPELKPVTEFPVTFQQYPIMDFPEKYIRLEHLPFLRCSCSIAGNRKEAKEL